MTNIKSLKNCMNSEEDDMLSNCTFINEIWIVEPTSNIIIKISLFLPVVLLAIIGNTTLIYVLLKNQNIQTPANILIGNMALADLLSVLIHPWVTLSYDLFQNYELGVFGCKTDAAFECAILITSVITLSVITYDRLTAIVLPKETRLKKTATKIVILLSWISGMLCSLPLGLSREYKERRWENFLEKFCMEKTEMVNIFWFVIMCVMVWIPLTIQLICYITIFVELTKYEKAVLKKLNRHQVSYRKNAVRMMFIVIITFMICRLPFTGFIVYRYNLLKNNQIMKSNHVQNQISVFYHTLWFLSKYLIFVNAAINPLVYGVTNQKFRNAFKTTKFSAWFFPPPVFRPAAYKHKQNNKTAETTLSRRIFLIFRNKVPNSNVEVFTQNHPTTA